MHAYLVNRPVLMLYVIKTRIDESVLHAALIVSTHTCREPQQLLGSDHSPTNAGLELAQQQALRNSNDEVHRRLRRQARVQAPLHARM